MATTSKTLQLKCVECGAIYDDSRVRYLCDCGDVLDVEHDLDALRGQLSPALFDERRASKTPANRSGVWRFRELILPCDESEIVTRWEGNTRLHRSDWVDEYVGIDGVTLKHEGDNPTGSFKDRGMTVGVTVAKRSGAKRVACASTGNTSASMASYASLAGLESIVFIPDGEIAFGKLAQALAFGACTIQLAGDFDDAMRIVQEVCAAEDIYLLNSINPFRIEGQKGIVFELLQDLDWTIPDWLVLPGGNLGNSAALFKGLAEWRELGLIQRLPRIAVVQAAGSNPLYTAFRTGEPLEPVVGATTLASAIRIGAPVSWKKSLRGVIDTDGVVVEVTDEEIMNAKARVDRAGIGAEPASCATVAGIRKLVQAGTIRGGESVAGILTGHVLKDPDAVIGYHARTLEGIHSELPNAPVRVPANLDAVLEALAASDA